MLLRVISNVFPAADIGTNGAPGPNHIADQPVPCEEMVLRLLSEYDGVIRQSQIASEFGWSPSKTSRLLSDMEAAGQVNRYWIGRQKTVYLPGSEPECLLATH